MNKRGSKYDGIKNAYERGSIGRIVKAQLILLSYRPGDLRDPWTFPHCFRATSSRYSVPAGSSRCARYFLLLVTNMGRFPELTPVRSQAIELRLTTLEAGDRW